MGFPAGYSEFIISKILLNLVSLLACIKNGLYWFLRSIGLTDLLEQELSDLTDKSSSAASSAIIDTIREYLPVVTFEDLADRFVDFDDTCAVCLNEFDKCEEIRQLTNCCHIFHKNCLDRWLDLDHKTCPLCRSSLMPVKTETEATEESWAVERLLYLFGEDMVFQS